MSYTFTLYFLDPVRGFQNGILVVLVLLLVGISSLKIPHAFLMRSGAQRNETLRIHTCSYSLQNYRLRFSN